MRRTAPVLSAVSAVLLLGACSSGGSSADPAERSGSTATAGSTPVSAPASLVLTTSSPTSDVCFTRGAGDLAFFDVTWKSLDDLESFSFRLLGAEGVRKIGSGWVVPPVNYGGRIDFGGAAGWEGWRSTINDRMLSPSQMDTVWAWTPSKDQTGLLVLHLRFDRRALEGRGASFDGVGAAYHTEDGRTGHAEVTTHQRFRARPAC